MEKHTVTIKSVNKVTHDVLQIVTNKPSGYNFVPGQATEISINKPAWEDERRPFTFTSLPQDDYLEFTIKTYPSHNGVTNELLQLKAGDELIVHDVFGTIGYQGEGIFIAGGAGVTPFISIFRLLQSHNKIGNNKLIFANKTKADIILQKDFEKLLGNNFINVLSDEEAEGFEHGYINEALLKKHIIGNGMKFYLCGPEPMMDAIEKQLKHLQVDNELIVKEQF